VYQYHVQVQNMIGGSIFGAPAAAATEERLDSHALLVATGLTVTRLEERIEARSQAVTRGFEQSAEQRGGVALLAAIADAEQARLQAPVGGRRRPLTRAVVAASSSSSAAAPSGRADGGGNQRGAQPQQPTLEDLQALLQQVLRRQELGQQQALQGQRELQARMQRLEAQLLQLQQHQQR
jgi:hypothetical protein